MCQDGVSSNSSLIYMKKDISCSFHNENILNKLSLSNCRFKISFIVMLDNKINIKIKIVLKKSLVFTFELKYQLVYQDQDLNKSRTIISTHNVYLLLQSRLIY